MNYPCCYSRNNRIIVTTLVEKKKQLGVDDDKATMVRQCSRDRLANNLGVMERNDNWFGEKKSTILIENKPWPFVDCKTMTTMFPL